MGRARVLAGAPERTTERLGPRGRLRPPAQDVRLLGLAVGALCGATAALGHGWPAGGVALVGALVLGCFPATRPHGAVLLGGACLVGAACALTVHAARPGDWVRADGQRVELTGLITARVQSTPTPWGGARCTASVVPTQVLLVAPARPIQHGAHGEQSTRGVRATPNRALSTGARIRVDVQVPCEAVAGQRVRANGLFTLNPPDKRSVGRLRSAPALLAGAGHPWSRGVRVISSRLAAQLADFPAAARGLIPGVALGDDSGLPRDVADDMRTTNLTHLTAVSGGHVSILLMLAIGLVGRRRRRLAAGLATAATIGLVALVGAEPSVLRAVGMSAFILWALARGRGSGAVPALCATVTMTCLISPWTALSVGFLLSVVATAGIVLLGSPLARELRGVAPAVVVQPVALSLAAQLACMPILAQFTDTSSAWSVVANALVAPVVAPLTIAGLAGALLAPVSPQLAHVPLAFASFAAGWIARVAHTFASAPGSGVSLGTAAFALVVLAALTVWAPSPLLRAGLGLAALVIAVLLGRALFGGGAIPAEWEALQCDVGQGAGLLLRSGRVTVLVDDGPPDGNIARCLRDAHLDHLDLLILTHFHEDHVGGTADVLATVPVARVWISGNDEPRPASRRLAALFAARGIPVDVAGRGSELKQGNVTVARVIWPKRIRGGAAHANDDALVIYSDVAGGVVVLSDSGREVQDALIADFAPTRTVIVAHHGSANQSAEAARRLTPELPVVSVGRNTYGHPAPATKALYPGAVTTIECGEIWWTTSERGSERCELGPWPNRR